MHKWPSNFTCRLFSIRHRSPFPVDPVSFDLARKWHRQNKFKDAERTLNYGYTKDPVDKPGKRTYNYGPDHQDLYAINRSIFELKKTEEEPTSSEEVITEPPYFHGSYRNFGYDDAVVEKRHFVEREPSRDCVRRRCFRRKASMAVQDLIDIVGTGVLYGLSGFCT